MKDRKLFKILSISTSFNKETKEILWYETEWDFHLDIHDVEYFEISDMEIYQSLIYPKKFLEVEDNIPSAFFLGEYLLLTLPERRTEAKELLTNKINLIFN